MSTPINTPEDAKAISYQSLAGSGNYHIWQNGEGVWCWSALGNTDTAKSEQEAAYAAKRWIRGER